MIECSVDYALAFNELRLASIYKQDVAVIVINH